MVTIWPLSMPAGMRTVRRLEVRTLPRPLHFGQGSEMIWPVPLQFGQVRTFWMAPKGVLEVVRTWPVPLQVGQVLGCVPGLAPVPLQFSHVSSRTRLISLSQPLAASSKEMVIS